MPRNCPCGNEDCKENDHLFWPEETEAIESGDHDPLNEEERRYLYGEERDQI